MAGKDQESDQCRTERVSHRFKQVRGLWRLERNSGRGHWCYLYARVASVGPYLVGTWDPQDEFQTFHATDLAQEIKTKKQFEHICKSRPRLLAELAVSVREWGPSDRTFPLLLTVQGLVYTASYGWTCMHYSPTRIPRARMCFIFSVYSNLQVGRIEGRHMSSIHMIRVIWNLTKSLVYVPLLDGKTLLYVKCKNKWYKLPIASSYTWEGEQTETAHTTKRRAHRVWSSIRAYSVSETHLTGSCVIVDAWMTHR